jgi:hypothetical protein
MKCKCCLAEASLLGRVPWRRAPADSSAEPDDEPKDLVPYNLCPRCGFLFSDLADAWSKDQWRQAIYKPHRFAKGRFAPDDSPSLDEDEAARGMDAFRMGEGIAQYFSGRQKTLRVLDFGSGGDPGLIGRAFQAQGFDLVSYDPYLDTVAEPPDGAFDLILVIEVIEHLVDLDTFGAQLRARLKPRGMLWIQTLLHPEPSAKTLESWYVTPHNGHFSIFTIEALWFLFRRFGINIVQHPYARAVIGFRETPDASPLLFCPPDPKDSQP